ncbi:MAG: hypothetical protein ABI856_14140 [Nitrospira sp.]
MRRKNGSRCDRPIASFLSLALLVLPISSCGYGRNQLSELRKESLTLSQQSGNRALSAEGRLRIAHELFEHRRSYESIIHHPSAVANDQQEARVLQRSDADTSGTAMQAIAEEHLVNGETDKARAIYYSIVTLFAEGEYASTRKAAESRLQELDEKERRKQSLR